MKKSELKQIIREEIKSILSEKNIKTQKWKKIPDHEWRPEGMSNSTVVKSGNFVTGYIDKGILHIQLGSSDKLKKYGTHLPGEADQILYRIEDNKGKMVKEVKKNLTEAKGRVKSFKGHMDSWVPKMLTKYKKTMSTKELENQIWLKFQSLNRHYGSNYKESDMDYESLIKEL